MTRGAGSGTTLALRAEPAVRKDGKCAVCRRQRKAALGVSKQAGSNAGAVEDATTDPFCSSDCCRSWHGCPLPESPSTRAARRRASEDDLYPGEDPDFG